MKDKLFEEAERYNVEQLEIRKGLPDLLTAMRHYQNGNKDELGMFFYYEQVVTRKNNVAKYKKNNVIQYFRMRFMDKKLDYSLYIKRKEFGRNTNYVNYDYSCSINSEDEVRLITTDYRLNDEDIESMFADSVLYVANNCDLYYYQEDEKQYNAIIKLINIRFSKRIIDELNALSSDDAVFQVGYTDILDELDVMEVEKSVEEEHFQYAYYLDLELYKKLNGLSNIGETDKQAIEKFIKKLNISEREGIETELSIKYSEMIMQNKEIRRYKPSNYYKFIKENYRKVLLKSQIDKIDRLIDYYNQNVMAIIEGKMPDITEYKKKTYRLNYKTFEIVLYPHRKRFKVVEKHKRNNANKDVVQFVESCNNRMMKAFENKEKNTTKYSNIDRYKTIS